MAKSERLQSSNAKIINFNLAKKDWFNNISKETQSPAGAYVTYNNEMCFPSINYQKVRYALRHEMTHVNDKSKQNYIDRSIFDTLKSGKYRYEFEDAGVPPNLIDYAHTNPAEYIAVASEGNMKSCSEGFKSILIKLGMPEWELDLEDIY